MKKLIVVLPVVLLFACMSSPPIDHTDQPPADLNYDSFSDREKHIADYACKICAQTTTLLACNIVRYAENNRIILREDVFIELMRRSMDELNNSHTF